MHAFKVGDVVNSLENFHRFYVVTRLVGWRCDVVKILDGASVCYEKFTDMSTDYVRYFIAIEDWETNPFFDKCRENIYRAREECGINKNSASKEGETKMEKTKNMVVSAVKHGAQVAASTAVADQVVVTIRKALGKNYPAFFETNLGKTLEPIILCSAVHYVATHFGGTIPASDKVAAVCELAIEGATAEHLGKAIATTLSPIFAQIATIKVS